MGLGLMRWETIVPKARPCPFCGCFKIRTYNRERYEEAETCGLGLTCMDCGAEIRWFPEDYETKESYDTALNNVLELWNRRE